MTFSVDGMSDSEIATANQDDFLPPLVRLQKYSTSENIFHRQMVGRLVLETLRAVADDPADVASVMAIVNKVADDPDAPVRVEIVEQVPHIAIFCQEDSRRLYHIVVDYLLPLVVKYLADNDNQVRKTAQAALLVLMEQGLVEQSAVELTVCPVILMLTEMDSLVEFHTGAVALMSKMAPLIGRSSTERLFLNRFAALCTDPVFYVRKVCAANFGEFCAIVGTESTESVLLPRFVDLCEDEIWGVRKACAEVFMSVSCACTLQTRKQSLAPVFANLLVDQSRWVRMSAFQTLGPFISTFADPSITGLSYNQAGELVVLSPEGFEFRLTTSQVSDNEIARYFAESKCSTSNLIRNGTNREGSSEMQASSESSVIHSVCDTAPCCSASAGVQERTVGQGEEEQTSDSKLQTLDGAESQQLRVRESQGQVHIHVESNAPSSAESFNTFQYWRVPIPELQLDISLAETGKPTAVHVKAKVMDETTQRTYASELSVDMDINAELDNLSSRLEESSLQCSGEEKPHHAQICTASVAMVTDTDKQGIENTTIVSSSIRKAAIWSNSGEVKMCIPLQKAEYKQLVPASWGDMTGTTEQWEGQQMEAMPVQSTPPVNQDIVPQQLIDHFVSMTHPSQAQKTDNEIAHHCAFSLPAVALTLGRENWILLKDAYDALASDLQWKVRRTVASSIHQLAVILGEDLATKDLVPVFNGFIKDLDEVRIGALKHLAEFLKLLRPPERNSYLPRLSEFLMTDNEWNWRFREELAEQLLAAVKLFAPEDTRQHLTPIAISLLLDKVAAVRQVALSLVTELVKHVSAEPSLLRGLLAELAERFAHSKQWNRRQTFALLCSHLVTKQVLSEELFARDVLPHLLDLSWDPVPNVRLSVARTLASNIMPQPYFSSEENPHHEVLIQVLKRLQADGDRDVRSFASMCPSTTEIGEMSVAGNS
ncbi:serine/threonine-protein phosphatase 4 regulatory subunit 1-like isoform X3 [Periplaneta americana]|uniref:serine/threonine-protein phosphatase 4 regulatory subunit 1-like isoform X3 n=1 Tax=Periplaneta americana TaxID=6978 RepID=UPI0037E6FB5F